MFPTTTLSMYSGLTFEASIAALEATIPNSTEPTSRSLPPNVPNGVRLQPTMKIP